MAAKDPKKGAARPRRSKEETQQEFARVQEDVEAAQQTTDAKTAEAARIHEAQIRQGIAELTLLAATKVTGKVLDSSDQRRLIDEAISSLDFSQLEGSRN